MDDCEQAADDVDAGRGDLPEDRRERVFEPFFSTKVEGTGMGLSTALGIADHEGGSVRVEDTPSGGATFVVRLPAAAAT
jgi:two-component system, NtrC family, sensor histidine kinase HydH